jgi:hypothetical protein
MPHIQTFIANKINHTQNIQFCMLPQFETILNEDERMEGGVACEKGKRDQMKNV